MIQHTVEAASFADHPVLHLSIIAVVIVIAAGALLIARRRRRRPRSSRSQA